MSDASIIGDFVIATGPDAAAWLQGLDGFRVSDGGGGVSVALRGDVQVRGGADGDSTIALADLIEGDVAAASDSVGGDRTHWRGRYAIAAWPRDGAWLEAATDQFGTVPLYWMQGDGHVAIASDLRLLLGAPGVRREADPMAIYHYLNFACIPAPATICRDIRRVEPGTTLRLCDGSVQLTRTYLPTYPADLDGSDTELADALRSRIVASVTDWRPDADRRWSCFLSGGTDSSSITSILARESGQGTVETCSIGFREAGYDELDFAKMAAEACGAQPHLAYVDRERSLGLIDAVVEAYDQPFGNASAIPTLACAELGQSQGFEVMLGGDGGDEIFGGNQRYAKDKVMEAFHALPSPLKALARWVGRTVGGGSSHLLNRIGNFATRASLPNPDRFYTDDSFASDFYDELLTPGFRAQVDRDASLDVMRAMYAQGGAVDPLHAIMRLDLAMAIAQNDIVKVHRACKHHGIVARFPYLDPALVDYCGRLPARQKVRGLQKRYLFKRAMAGILPAAILQKRKQGFGLPTAVWMKDDPVLQAHVRSVLLDARTAARGWIEPAFVARLLDMHIAGGWDHSAAIWQLVILELWLRRYIDAP